MCRVRCVGAHARVCPSARSARVCLVLCASFRFNHPATRPSPPTPLAWPCLLAVSLSRSLPTATTTANTAKQMERGLDVRHCPIFNTGPSWLLLFLVPPTHTQLIDLLFVLPCFALLSLLLLSFFALVDDTTGVSQHGAHHHSIEQEANTSHTGVTVRLFLPSHSRSLAISSCLLDFADLFLLEKVGDCVDWGWYVLIQTRHRQPCGHNCLMLTCMAHFFFLLPLFPHPPQTTAITNKAAMHR